MPQDWRAYTSAEHALWDRLFARQSRAAGRPRGSGVPAGPRRPASLQARHPGLHRAFRAARPASPAGAWSPCPGWCPDDVFFDHLAHRRFVAGRFIRRPDQIDYLQEPDVFHDVFGHVPLLTRPGVRRLHAGLRRGRPARRAAGRDRAAGAALLAHGGVRPDPTAPRACASTAPASSPATARASTRWTSPRRRGSPSTCRRVMRTRYASTTTSRPISSSTASTTCCGRRWRPTSRRSIASSKGVRHRARRSDRRGPPDRPRRATTP